MCISLNSQSFVGPLQAFLMSPEKNSNVLHTCTAEHVALKKKKKKKINVKSGLKPQDSEIVGCVLWRKQFSGVKKISSLHFINVYK